MRLAAPARQQLRTMARSEPAEGRLNWRVQDRPAFLNACGFHHRQHVWWCRMLARRWRLAPSERGVLAVAAKSARSAEAGNAGSWLPLVLASRWEAAAMAAGAEKFKATGARRAQPHAAAGAQKSKAKAKVEEQEDAENSEAGTQNRPFAPALRRF